MIKARVTVTLKNGVLDPQGKAIEHALSGLGFDGVGSVRQGKVFDVELAGDRQGQGRSRPEGHVRQASGEYGDRELQRSLSRSVDMKSAVVLLPGLNRDRDMIAALTKISGKAPVTVWETDTDIPDVDLIAHSRRLLLSATICAAGRSPRACR